MKPLIAFMLALSLCAPGMAQTTGKKLELPQSGGTSTVTTLWPVQSTYTTQTPPLQPQVAIGDSPFSKVSSGQITWATSIIEPDNLRLTYTAIWLSVSRDDVKVGWLIPACTTANLKRAPKLTAWVIGMQAYSSPQARWLSALFKGCEIQ
jgi:hypothetical protein